MTTTAITELGRGHLATLMCEIRPEWDIAGCVAALRKINPTIPAAAIGIAAMRYTADPTNLTPAHLADLGNHAWDTDSYPPCPTHGHTPRRTTGECAYCWAEHHGDDTGTPTPRAATPPPKPLRQLIADTRPATPAETTTGSEAR